MLWFMFRSFIRNQIDRDSGVISLYTFIFRWKNRIKRYFYGLPAVLPVSAPELLTFIYPMDRRLTWIASNQLLALPFFLFGWRQFSFSYNLLSFFFDNYIMIKNSENEKSPDRGWMIAHFTVRNLKKVNSNSIFWGFEKDMILDNFMI